jgi:tRNA 2-thiocytidine biosynthesis protein TtcA
MREYVMQRILSNLRKAVEEFDMIEDGDKIAVGLSGGKDSITLLMALKNLQIFYPKKFKLIAVTINPGFEEFNPDYIKNLCEKIGVELVLENTYIKQIVFDERKEENPCSLCANLRRGILNSIAKREGCNKIALGHNQNDLIETLFLNLLYGGKIHTFAPVKFLDRSSITLIRPLIYTEEKEIKRFIRQSGIEPMPKCCPMDGYSKREDMKNLITNFRKEIPRIDSNLLGAIRRCHIEGWYKKNEV